jgi:hypothetical protein
MNRRRWVVACVLFGVFLAACSSQATRKQVKVLDQLTLGDSWVPVRAARMSRDQGGSYGVRFFKPAKDFAASAAELCEQVKSGDVAGTAVLSPDPARECDPNGTDPVSIGFDVVIEGCYDVTVRDGYDRFARGPESEQRGLILTSRC